ncbi:uncharacterized protein LOC110059965 isoform X5 [Orbicella faveolata]|uniref:uncharacterized protein LOC110059965 isoform X5 n=1 Tax=Orbicella faveolata TaxID=48498 RepID=UPI0009E3EBB5|nr:uncharacterized protein LOC110059965 isoform X5 [Orbicella faveolata]
MRRLLQWFVGRCLSFSLWQFIQIAIVVSYLSAQFVLHVQLSTRLTDALARLDKLEDYINGKENERAQIQSYDTRPDHVHSRGKRRTHHEGNLNDLWRRLETLENQDHKEGMACREKMGYRGATGRTGYLEETCRKRWH